MRVALGGRGVGTHSVYQPKALEGWAVAKSSKSKTSGYVWKSKLSQDHVELPEEKLEGLELELLKASPGIYDIYMGKKQIEVSNQ